MSNQIYEWLNLEKARFYKLKVQADEQNGIILSYLWGGCNSNRGGKKSLCVPTHEEARKLIDKMKKRRKSRGYSLIHPS